MGEWIIEALHVVGRETGEDTKQLPGHASICDQSWQVQPTAWKDSSHRLAFLTQFPPTCMRMAVSIYLWISSVILIYIVTHDLV